jgi:hypothetical protein
MLTDEITSSDQALEAAAIPLFGGALLFKSIAEGDTAMRFAGIASDEEEDVDGERILKKSLDLTYARQRGFVNWDHSRQPNDQLGYLTRAEVIAPKQVTELKKSFPGQQISETASVYVEGELYPNVPRAVEVYNIMKSTPDHASGLGLSIDGSVAKDLRNGGIVKAFVRGVAVTPQPAQPRTLLRLRKSLQAYTAFAENGGEPADLPKEIAAEVVSLIQKSAGEPKTLPHDKAVLFVLQQRPNWTYELAKRVVDYTIQSKKKGN